MADYKCTSAGCYSYNSPTKNQQLLKLQSTINRYSASAGFAPLATDGIVGKATYQASIFALDYVTEEANGTLGASAAAIIAMINSPEQLTIYAQNVIDTLLAAADEIPGVLSPSSNIVQVTTPNPPAIVVTAPNPAQKLNEIQTKYPQLSTSIGTRINLYWAQLSTPAKVVTGVLGGLVFFGGVHYAQKHVKSAGSGKRSRS